MPVWGGPHTYLSCRQGAHMRCRCRRPGRRRSQGSWRCRQQNERCGGGCCGAGSTVLSHERFEGIEGCSTMLLTCCNAQNELHVTKPVYKAEHASYRAGAGLAPCDSGLVADSAYSLRRCSCCESREFMHPAAPSFPCAMHAGDQAGARSAPPPPHSGVGQPGRPCHASPCSAVRERSKGCDSVVMILFKHAASSEGLSLLCMVKPALDIESSRSARMARLTHCAPA